VHSLLTATTIILLFAWAQDEVAALKVEPFGFLSTQAQD